MGRGLQRRLLRPPPWGVGPQVRLPGPGPVAYSPGLASTLRSNTVATGRKVAPTPRPCACKRHFGDGPRQANGPQWSPPGWTPQPRKRATCLRLWPWGGPRAARPPGWPGKLVSAPAGDLELAHGEARGTGRPLRRRPPRERNPVATLGTKGPSAGAPRPQAPRRCCWRPEPFVGRKPCAA